LEPIGLSVEEAKRHLGGISSATLYRRIADGSITAVKVGSRTIITYQSIKALVASAPRLGVPA
jgi:excisionase family DNA binding protein